VLGKSATANGSPLVAKCLPIAGESSPYHESRGGEKGIPARNRDLSPTMLAKRTASF
jgi:hypothetical protein